ncbi:quinone oxidoreductase family protein [Companilactobacillus keshanensis]|uniref:Zinc-binding alcohol dehydrogenase family protein n=1 Tax=Companilactobacillus keshanensis TaxID=2486003 RepID=A0ABW4BRN6_9LACO|nr:zinc-binding alcohol dehydrogenase family protein [Companilactobacillus keshanensis]
MKAAIITEKGMNPVYGTFEEPKNGVDNVVVDVTASALSNLAKMRAMGQHYSASQVYPNVAGTDGVGILNGKRVYFLATNAPYGTLAEKSLVNRNLIVPLPDRIDDVTAAAIANPGMSSWAALVNRAHFESGQTVLINGATGTAGSLAVKIAYHLGAKKVIVTGRNLEKLNKLDADAAIVFDMTETDGANKFTTELSKVCHDGIDVVLDYLWGDSALSIMIAIAKFSKSNGTKFISIGAASGQSEISLPSAVLRSSKIEILGSGVKSVPMEQLMLAISNVFDWADQNHITLTTNEFDLSEITDAWNAPLTPRAVIKVQ